MGKMLENVYFIIIVIIQEEIGKQKYANSQYNNKQKKNRRNLVIVHFNHFWNFRVFYG
jgi:hypothetical protein